MLEKIDFKETRTLFWRYKGKRLPKGKLNPKRRLGDEVSARLIQMEVLFNEILELLENEKSGNTNIPSYKLWIHVEAFYYIAFHNYKLIQKLPRLENFKCQRIRDIRNKLVEHSHADRPVYSYTFSWGDENGPVMRPKRIANDSNKYIDEGLFVNYFEFQERLCNLINKAMLPTKSN